MSEPTNPSPCPRCGAPVTGEFKFCPTCACRLQESPEWEAEPPRRRSWSHAVLVLFLGGLFAAILVIGYRLFGEPPARPPSNGDTRPELAGPLTVAHLRDRMVHVYGATATYWGSPDGTEDWPVQVANCLFSELEITRGEWNEFVEACRADPTQVPPWLRDLWRPDVAEAAEEDTPEQQAARAFANQYIDVWWDRVQANHAEVHGQKVERPRDLVAPLPEAYGVLLLVPPTWVRIGDYEEFGSTLPEGTARLPVTDICWFDANAFATWAGETLGIEHLRLPTAMEWISAGNGGDPDRRYPWGSEVREGGRLPRFACNSTSFWAPETPQMLEVDYRFADGGNTPEGVQQMSGNAREWLLNHELVPRDRYYGSRPIETFDIEVPSEENPAKVVTVTRVRATAPTLGGSFRQGIEDCTVDMTSLKVLSKFGRWNDVGFRLWAPSDWMGR